MCERAFLCVTFAAGLTAISASAAAQEIQLTGPLASPQTFYAVQANYVAERTDAYAWLSLGATPAPDKLASPFWGGGAEITNIVTRTAGLLNIPSELRWGPWGEAWSDSHGGRAEGGLAAQLYLFGRRVHTPVDLRVGAGYGEDLLGRVPHVALTISGGPRYIEGVKWPPLTDRHGDPIDVPQLLVGWRLFFSGRRTIEDVPQYWVTCGIEMELGFVSRDRLPTL